MLRSKPELLESMDSVGETPLNYLAVENNLEGVRLLAQMGADVNSRDDFRSTALHHAARLGSSEMVELLITLGADANAKDQEDEAPLHRVVPLEEASAIVAAILRADPDVHSRETFGWAPLHLACSCGAPSNVKLLIQHSADVNDPGEDNSPPLFHIQGTEAVQIAKVLVQHGARLDHIGSWGWTVLHSAAARGELTYVRWLLEQSLDPTARNEDGLTPGELAKSAGHDEVALLIDSTER